MRQKALIDINMLLDTRLGVLARLNHDVAHAIVSTDWYRARETDRFDRFVDGAISNDDYVAMYQKYEVETLVNSLFTDFLYILKKEVDNIAPEFKLMDNLEIVEFDINVYPYSLLPSEKEVIRKSVAHYLPAPAVVNVVDIAYHLLTPGLLSSNYDMMAIYNYEDWLKYHEENLSKNPIQDFTVFYPRIAPSGEVPEPDEYIKDPFMTVPMVLTNVVQMNPIPTFFTCWNPVVYRNLIMKDREQMAAVQGRSNSQE